MLIQQQSNHHLFIQIRETITALTGIKPEKILDNSRFEQDLRITGDDLVELIDALFQKLHIEQGDFTYAKYAGAEGLNLLGGLTDRLFGRSIQPCEPLTVAMFVQAARAGRWDSQTLI